MSGYTVQTVHALDDAGIETQVRILPIDRVMWERQTGGKITECPGEADILWMAHHAARRIGIIGESVDLDKWLASLVDYSVSEDKVGPTVRVPRTGSA